MKKILIANRGEIALRIMRTCREMGIATVAVVSEADRDSAHAQAADECHWIGEAAVSESYLRGDRIVEAALEAGADGIHPGFGFLSEQGDFADLVREAGLIFIGPSGDVIRKMGSKQVSKRLMAKAGVPVVPGYTGSDQSPERLLEEAEAIGFPLLIKASAGGGGKGMRVVEGIDHFIRELDTARREAESAFGDGTVLLERYLTRPRHIEFQVFGDQHGNLVHLYERECSIQRRHQKILEETPSPALKPAIREQMAQAAIAAARTAQYENAGTVEFMLDEDDSFYFLEMNTRLQVEHPVTEFLTGIDLVRWQIEIARGKPLPLRQDQIQPRGHAIEVRVYAEDPDQNFFPQVGTIHRYQEPQGLGIRVDSGVREGDQISVFYDPMIAKLIAYGADRDIARQKLVQALCEYCIHGVKTNLTFLGDVLADPRFIAGETTTDFLSNGWQVPDPEQAALNLALGLAMLGGTPPAQQGRRETAVNDPWSELADWRNA